MPLQSHRDWMDTEWESAHKPRRRKFSCQDSNSQPFNYKSSALPTHYPGSPYITGYTLLCVVCIGLVTLHYCMFCVGQVTKVITVSWAVWVVPRTLHQVSPNKWLQSAWSVMSCVMNHQVISLTKEWAFLTQSCWCCRFSILKNKTNKKTTSLMFWKWNTSTALVLIPANTWKCISFVSEVMLKAYIQRGSECILILVSLFLCI